MKKGAKVKDASGKQKIFASCSTSSSSPSSAGIVATKKAEKNWQETSPLLGPLHF